MPRATKEFARLLETSDDAAVIRLSDELCLVQTVDFFTPIVDDPYWFGQIAAANALSDVYAMGARPLTAMNLVAWPVELGLEPLGQILTGGAEKVAESGAELAGGHSIDDKEPKYGLAVTGVAHPDEIVYNGGAQPGDKLVLTKRLGIGVLASALKNGLIAEAGMMDAIHEAAQLNAAASQAMLAVGVHACTDVSGFGLAGHLSEMLDASSAMLRSPGVSGDASSAAAGSAAASAASGSASSAWAGAGVGAVLDLRALPLHDGVLDLIGEGVYAGGLRANRDYLRDRCDGLDQPSERVLAVFDPQTSGGLLLAVAPERHATLLAELAARGVGAYTVGEVIAGAARIELRV